MHSLQPWNRPFAQAQRFVFPPVHFRHSYDACSYVINKGVEELATDHPPRHVLDRLEEIIPKKLRCHGDKADAVAADGRACQRP